MSEEQEALEQQEEIKEPEQIIVKSPEPVNIEKTPEQIKTEKIERRKVETRVFMGDVSSVVDVDEDDIAGDIDFPLDSEVEDTQLKQSEPSVDATAAPTESQVIGDMPSMGFPTTKRKKRKIKPPPKPRPKSMVKSVK